jgi:hypothetical protein
VFQTVSSCSPTSFTLADGHTSVAPFGRRTTLRGASLSPGTKAIWGNSAKSTQQNRP